MLIVECVLHVLVSVLQHACLCLDWVCLHSRVHAKYIEVRFIGSCLFVCLSSLSFIHVEWEVNFFTVEA